MNNNLENQFNTIVNSLLSPRPIEPYIIREHIWQYAQDAGVSYDLAKQAVILKAGRILIGKIESI